MEQLRPDTSCLWFSPSEGRFASHAFGIVPRFCQWVFIKFTWHLIRGKNSTEEAASEGVFSCSRPLYISYL